jgi:hypothetical protein
LAWMDAIRHISRALFDGKISSRRNALRPYGLHLFALPEFFLIVKAGLAGRTAG